MSQQLPADLPGLVKTYVDEICAIRRDIHAHPELGRAEIRTTRIVRQRLEAAGQRVTIFPSGTGLTCDIGPSGPGAGPILALRADLDALPIADEKAVPYRSTVPGVAHACGHDVHTAILLGTGLVLADLAAAGELRRPVRLLFQPAEEVLPGGALDVIEAGGLQGVERILALHCDPKVEVGQIALRTGPITAACDKLMVRLTGSGGHTARPHLTADLIYALSKLVTELPAVLSRRVDPRAGMSLVWGRIVAGSAANAIPQVGEVEGTLRCLDLAAWHSAPELVRSLVDDVARMYGVSAELRYDRGVPPVVNDADSTALFRTAAAAVLGPHAVTSTEQSLGGEDFAWYLESVSGALARLGVRSPGETGARDIHQGTFDIDERAVGVGMSLLAAAALLPYA